MKVEKMAKNGEKGQNCYPLSPPDEHAAVLRVGRILLFPGRAHERQELHDRVQVGGLRHPVEVSFSASAYFHRAQTHLFRVLWREHDFDEVFECRGRASAQLDGRARLTAALHRVLLPGARVRGKCALLDRLSSGRRTDPKRISASRRREAMRFDSTCTPSSPRTMCFLRNTMPCLGSDQG